MISLLFKIIHWMCPFLNRYHIYKKIPLVGPDLYQYVYKRILYSIFINENCGRPIKCNCIPTYKCARFIACLHLMHRFPSNLDPARHWWKRPFWILWLLNCENHIQINVITLIIRFTSTHNRVSSLSSSALFSWIWTSYGARENVIYRRKLLIMWV